MAKNLDINDTETEHNSRYGDSHDDPLVGKILGTKYRIDSRIGGGGMGAVYRAEHMFMQRKVAIKLVNPKLMRSEKYENMLRSEAMLASRFNHQNAVTLHDFGFLADGRTFYLVMEYLRGRTLRRELKRLGVILEDRVTNIMRQVTSAMAAAHNAHIVHLDLKPENIMLVSHVADGKDVVKILDFGVSRFTGAHTQAAVAGREKNFPKPDRILGTLRYMSPEQIVGEGIDARSDIFSLGIIMYEMLTGRYPYEAKTKKKLIQNIIQAEPQRFKKIAPHLKISEAMEKVVMRCIEKDPAERYENAAGLHAAIDRASVEREAEKLQVRIAAKELTLPEPADYSFLQKAGHFIKSKIIHRKKKLTPEEANAPEGMVFVPAGEFKMGFDIASSDEAPMHDRYVDAFYIDIYLVTNKQYKKFIDETGNEPPSNWKTVTFPAGLADYPVTHVTWFDAKAYCEWAGKRLPTEAEWEKAARGIDGRCYPWGNKWRRNICNWGGMAGIDGPQPSPVGHFKLDRSPYNCMDMCGNVKEWTEDWYEKYYLSTHTHPDYGQKFKVLRGGSCETKDRNLMRITKRSRAKPHERGLWGFRCALSVTTWHSLEK